MISKLVLPFWNPNEHRLRSFWRLLLQIILLLIITIILTLGVVAVAIANLTTRGISVTDPGFANVLTHALTQDPVLDALTRIASFIGIVLSVVIAGWLLDRRPLFDFGFRFTRRWWKDFAFGLALGAVLMLGIFSIELGLGWITITGMFYSTDNFFISILVYLVAFIGVGIQEELFSRGYQLRNVAEGMNWRFIGPRAALIIGYVGSSIVFGALHLGNPNTSTLSTINLIIAGLFLGLGFVLTGDLAIPIGLHIAWNFFQGNVFGFPVSGITITSTFIAIKQGGPDLITGGAFGPEAGIIGLAAMFIGSVLIVLWVRRQYGHIAIQERLAQYSKTQTNAPK
jgi:membrane protease YdiL (CAAX protease family)